MAQERSASRFRGAATLQLLTQRNFGLLWLAETISQVGDTLNRVALLWFVYQTSHSALRMSLVGVLQTVPPLAIGPLIGAYLDRLRKKPALVAISLVRGVLVSVIPLMYAAQMLTLPVLYALVFLIAVVGTAAGPALLTVVPLVVASDDLVAANALIQSTSTLGVLLGPAIAGLGISLVGVANVLYIDAASFVVFAFLVAFMSVPERGLAARAPLRLRDLRDDLREGVSFLFRRQVGILVLTGVTGLQNIGASAFVLMLPVFVKQDFAARSVWLGLLWSAFGLGMLLASVSIALFSGTRVARLLRIALLTLALAGSSVAALSFVRAKVAATMLMVVVGWSSAAFNPVVITLVQGSTPVDLRARVLTAFSSANMAAVAVGILAFGFAADRLGSDLTMLGIGAVFLMSAIVLGTVMRLQTTRRLVENLAESK